LDELSIIVDMIYRLSLGMRLYQMNIFASACISSLKSGIDQHIRVFPLPCSSQTSSSL
jgi:hypothetical protein